MPSCPPPLRALRQQACGPNSCGPDRRQQGGLAAGREQAKVGNEGERWRDGEDESRENGRGSGRRRGREGERAGGSGREREGKGERREGERERDLNFPSGRGAVARQGLAEGRDWRAPPAAAAAPARLAELHEAAAGAGRAEGTASLSPAEPRSGTDGCRDRQVGAGRGPGGRGRAVGNRVLALLSRSRGSPEGWGVLLSQGTAPQDCLGARRGGRPAAASTLRGRTSRGAERTAPCEGLASRLNGSETDPGAKRWGPPSAPPPPAEA